MSILDCEEAILRSRIAENLPGNSHIGPSKARAVNPPLPRVFPSLGNEARGQTPPQIATRNQANASYTFDGDESALCAKFSSAIDCGASTSNSAPICGVGGIAPQISHANSSPTPIFEKVAEECALHEGNLSRNSSSTHLRYERKSPTRSVSELPASNLFDNLPWHVMYTIFDNFELRDRIRASMVCKRWRTLLTDGRFPLEDVVVMNIFESEVWETSLSSNTGAKFQCAELSNFSQFESILAQCFVSTSVKIWYLTTTFARQVLEKLRKCNVKMRCLDIYPYSQHIGIQHFYEYLPDVKGMTMRPHGKDYFFDGLGLTSFPNFSQLETLNLDCINLSDDIQLPPTLTTLEWQSRNDYEFRKFLPKLALLCNLQFLLLGHAEFQGCDFAYFLDMVNLRRMENLQYLIFKFVKIDNLDHVTSEASFRKSSQLLAANAAENTLLGRLQFLKFDLCYGNLSQMMDVFLNITSTKLRIISLNLLSDENTKLSVAFQSRLFGCVARRLHERQIALHLGFLQRDSTNKTPPTAAVKCVCDCKRECACSLANGGTSAQDENMPQVTRHFELVLGKFEASFVSDLTLLRGIFGTESQRFPMLTELKFIQCDALTDELLGSIATCCVYLRKLSILSCSKCDETGIRRFVELFHHRKSPVLKVVWKRDRHKYMRPSNFFLNLINEYKHLLTGLKYRFMCKVFGEGNNGEAIIVWQGQKKLFIQDFDEFDRNRILGIVLPNPVSLESTTPRPSYPPYVNRVPADVDQNVL